VMRCLGNIRGLYGMMGKSIPRVCPDVVLNPGTNRSASLDRNGSFR
jgi:hypothetical protein